MSQPDTMNDVVSLDDDFYNAVIDSKLSDANDDVSQKIKKQKQQIAKFERNLALLKIKDRKLDTRKKIEFGGLVIKSKMAVYPKAVILGALIDTLEQLENNPGAESLFQSKGEAAFMGYGDQNKT